MAGVHSMKYIRRSIEDVIENSAQSFKAVLVTGARQSGKRTLLQELFPKRKTITFDDQFLEDTDEYLGNHSPRRLSAAAGSGNGLADLFCKLCKNLSGKGCA